MKTIFATLMLALSFSAPALADSYTTNRVGNYEYTNGPDGYQGTANQVGNYQYYNDNAGNHCTTNRVGAMTYTNCD